MKLLLSIFIIVFFLSGCDLFESSKKSTKTELEVLSNDTKYKDIYVYDENNTQILRFEFTQYIKKKQNYKTDTDIDLKIYNLTNSKKTFQFTVSVYGEANLKEWEYTNSTSIDINGFKKYISISNNGLLFDYSQFLIKTSLGNSANYQYLLQTFQNTQNNQTYNPNNNTDYNDILFRDNTQLPPTYYEDLQLKNQDEILFRGVVTYDRYKPYINSVRKKANISPSVNIIVDTDFRNNGMSYFGGVCGHNIIILDGKFLDILYDYATFMVKKTLYKDFYETVVEGVDNIVYHHSLVYQFSGYYYNYILHTEDMVDRYFEELLGSLLYHEFGHYYLYHALDSLRSQYTVFQNLVMYSSLREDQADYISGVLMKKSGFNIEKAYQMVDIMAFYASYFSNSVYTFSQIKDSMAAQFVKNNIQYSSLSDRKKFMLKGYQSY